MWKSEWRRKREGGWRSGIEGVWVEIRLGENGKWCENEKREEGKGEEGF